MYTVSISRKQIVWGIAVFLVISMLILSAIIVKNADAQGLIEYNLNFPVPICVTGEGGGLNPAGKPRDGELGSMRLALHEVEGELHFNYGPCNENEFPLVVHGYCLGPLGSDFNIEGELVCVDLPIEQ